ncbi:hypothetical protein [Actinoplanes sp. NPDC026670]|uniref:hypothetical protein n=1 Tax=Actinoplanes sp. NPDC026670 TaxID=3154700 RepID=UPI0033DF1B5E
MSDEFPRPYAEEPPAPEPVSGLRLVRTRPWGVAAAVLITFVVTVAYPLTVNALMTSPDYDFGPAFWAAGVTIDALPEVVSLTIVAALAGRRVTVGRALGFLVASIGLVFAQSLLFTALPFSTLLEAGLPLEVLSPVIHALTLLAHGLLGIVLFPPVSGRSNLWGLVVASVAVAVLNAVELWTPVPVIDALPLGWPAVDAVLLVGWAIAVLVTSPSAAPAWVATPSDLGRQDP